MRALCERVLFVLTVTEWKMGGGWGNMSWIATDQSYCTIFILPFLFLFSSRSRGVRDRGGTPFKWILLLIAYSIIFLSPLRYSLFLSLTIEIGKVKRQSKNGSIVISEIERDWVGGRERESKREERKREVGVVLPFFLLYPTGRIRTGGVEGRKKQAKRIMESKSIFFLLLQSEEG